MARLCSTRQPGILWLTASGLDAPPSGATKGSEIALKKWPLRAEEVAELEDSPAKPSWALATIAETTAPSGSKRLDRKSTRLNSSH